MLARIQQLIALTLLCAAIAAFALGPAIGAAWLGPAFIAAVIAVYAGVLAIEFCFLRASYGRDDADRPRLSQLLRAWAAEVTAAPRVFLWNQPFRSASEPDRLHPAAPNRRGVVLVHGFFCNRGVWNPWLRRLRAADVPFAAISLEPVFGSIGDYGEAIAATATALERATGLAPVIVAHSMGGLAVRAWMNEDVSANAHCLITIAAPHRGTRLARHGRGHNVAQMREGSKWLADLARRDTATSRTPVVCFWSHCDNVVFPTRNATLAGADNRHLEATPHVAMIFHPAVFEEVLRSVGVKA